MLRDEMRIRGYPEVLESDAATSRQRFPTFGIHNSLPNYQVGAAFSAFTLGLESHFVPLRPACPAGAGDLLSAACAAAAAPPASLAPANPAGQQPQDAIQHTVKDAQLISAGITDADGRLLCNPDGTSPARQALEALRAIQRSRKYILVR